MNCPTAKQVELVKAGIATEFASTQRDPTRFIEVATRSRKGANLVVQGEDVYVCEGLMGAGG